MNEWKEQASKEKKYWRKNYLWSLAVLAVLAVYFLFFNPGVTIEPGTDGLKASAPHQETVAVSYADVESLILTSQPDYGVCLSGADKGSHRYGQWQNEAWGDYRLFAYRKVDACIVIKTADLTLVVNGASEQETESFYQMLRESCPQAVTASA
ncbi:MAG: hypothetical protein GXW99_09495 [Clostridiales bacterium]|nr:hypothetical protein [Clostridiales bacterium]